MKRALLAVALACLTAQAHADGKLVVGKRVLIREGPAERAYCQEGGTGSPEECDHVLSKVLSGYTYGRGNVSGGLVFDADGVGGVGGLHLSPVSADLPGGKLGVANLDVAIGDGATSRLRLAVFEGEGLFRCRDAQNHVWVAPIIGMFTRACVPNSWFGFDVGLLTGQWDFATGRLGAEWIRIGPAFELLGNGLGYAHILRSIEIAVPLDVRTVYSGERDADNTTTFGAGVRLSAFYRTPAWETRLALRARSSLVGAGGVRRDTSADGELLLLHNFFLSDALVMQAGLSARMSWARLPANTFVVWSSAAHQFGAFAGLHVGWVHEAPDI